MSNRRDMEEKIRQILFPLRSRKSLVAVAVLLLLLLTLLLTIVTVQKPTQTRQQAAGTAIQHYLYVFPEGGIVYVYDIDHNHALVKTITLPPGVSFIRGVGADPASHSLFIAYGSVSSGGQLMKMDLLTNQVIYNKQMPVGIDSFDITPDGKKIYMPDGDGQSDGIWRVVDAATGNVTASIDTGGHNPHNTFVSLNGTHVYLGPRLSNTTVVDSESEPCAVCNDKAWPELDGCVATATRPSGAAEQAGVHRPGTRRVDALLEDSAAPSRAAQAAPTLELAQRPRREAG